MIRTPAQHQTDPNKVPGQVKNKFTFDEWWKSRLNSWKNHYFPDKEAAKMIWEAAQENK